MAPSDGDRPVTKHQFDEGLAQLKAEMQEFRRDMQTELLRGFEKYLKGRYGPHA
jgi:hypothetical protein